MSIEDDNKGALIPAQTTALSRAGAVSLARRGLRDVEAAEEIRGVMRIFVVDDEECVRATISAMLTNAGYSCRTFAGGLEALALLESGAGCDLLTSDLLNSPLDGFSLLTRMKENLPDIPVIMVTAIHDPSVATACSQLGAQYLTKPLEREQLLVAVRRAFEDRRLKLEKLRLGERGQGCVRASGTALAKP